jgi:hypothetical protein
MTGQANRKFRRIGGLALLALGIMLAGPAAESAQPGPAAAPRIEVSQTMWNFGELWQGLPRPSVEIEICNKGDAPLTMEIKSTCGCTYASKPKNPLGPGECDRLKITYDSVGKRGPAKQTITIVTNDPRRPNVAIEVRGNVKPLYLFRPIKNVSFGKLWSTSSETRSIQIRNEYTEPINLELKADQDFGPFEVEMETLSSGQRYRVVARTKPPLTVGTHVRPIEIETGLERMPSFQIQVYGTVEPPIKVDTKQLFLPKSSLREVRHRLRVAYAPARPVKIREVRATHASIKTELGALNEGAGEDAPTQELVVVLPPGDQIPDGAEPSIEILTDADDPALAKIVIPIRILGARSSP